MTNSAPGDQAARDQIGRSLDENLFVEAGAGTGKTTALVARMAALVVDEGIPIEEIAAITFTEKAAAELGDRFRRTLENVARQDDDPERRRRADTALADVDLAALTTLHGFARRLLTDHPLEAGLPPGFEVLDEISSGLGFDDRWADLQRLLLDDDDLARTVLLADALGVRMSHLRDLSQDLDDRWDLLSAPPKPRDPAPVVLDGILDLMDRAVALDRHDLDEDDTLRVRIDMVRKAAEMLRGAVDEIDALRILQVKPVLQSFNVGNKGKKEVWGDLKVEITDLILEARAQRETLLEAVAEDVLQRLLGEAIKATLAASVERRRLGCLTFHDLLVVARDLLVHPTLGSRVRSTLHQRYRRLLLDEFQDTDPLQLELALLLTDPGSPADTDLEDFVPEPGALFLVGDPKQSIYRFRRADISLYLQVRQFLDAARPALTENFRTTVPIIGWVNAVFGQLIGSNPASGNGATPTDLVQPDYTPLVGRRPAAAVGPAVTILGRRAHGEEVNAPELQEMEATDVSEIITTAMVDGWTIEDDDGTQRPCRFSDIAILLPTKTSLPALEAALEAADIPFRAESSSMLFATPQVRDILMVLRAIDDPTDDLAVVAALRTPYLGCGDDDLARWKVHHGGSWNHKSDQPDGDPTVAVVADGLAWLADVHDQRHHLGPSGVLERLVHDRRVLQVAFGEARPRDAWRRVRLLADRARAFAESGGGSLRGFVDWCLTLADDKSRVAETVLPEVDDDAVRILTIHGAKGLEFPVTILSGMSSAKARQDTGPRLLSGHGGSLETRIRKGDEKKHIPAVETHGFQQADEIHCRFEDAEAVRLLYVATTRARDHLVVSVHRATDVDPDKSERPGHGRRLAQALDELGGDVHDTDLTPTDGVLPPPAAPSMRPLPDRRTWITTRDQAIERAGRPSTVSATAIAAHVAARAAAERPPDPDEDRARPGEVGRHGTGVGRAVHGALELLDFDTTDPASTIREQAVAEGLLGDLRTIDALVRAGLGAEVVRLAAGSRHWRELYVAAPVDDDPGAPVVEGYVDLAVLDDRGDTPGLVIVDYKTDAVADDAERASKADRYRLQGATYALAAERATGHPVRRVVLCFLAADGATEVEVADLAGAMNEVRAAARELAGS